MATYKLNTQELSTVLAALRYYQNEGLAAEPCRRPDEIHEIATNDGSCVSLGQRSVESLCERLNSEDDDPTECEEPESVLIHVGVEHTVEETCSFHVLAPLNLSPEKLDEFLKSAFEDAGDSDDLGEWETDVCSGRDLKLFVLDYNDHPARPEPTFTDKLCELGFTREGTSGGCSCYVRFLRDSKTHLVVTDCDCCAPDDSSPYIGVYEHATLTGDDSIGTTPPIRWEDNLNQPDSLHLIAEWVDQSF